MVVLPCSTGLYEVLRSFFAAMLFSTLHVARTRGNVGKQYFVLDRKVARSRTSEVVSFFLLDLLSQLLVSDSPLSEAVCAFKASVCAFKAHGFHSLYGHSIQLQRILKPISAHRQCCSAS